MESNDRRLVLPAPEAAGMPVRWDSLSHIEKKLTDLRTELAAGILTPEMFAREVERVQAEEPVAV